MTCYDKKIEEIERLYREGKNAEAEAAEKKLDDIYLPAGCGAGEKMRAMNAKGQK